MSNKICFLFGAGAESGFGIPKGPEYTQQTMLREHPKLYEELDKFYGNRVEQNFSQKYKRLYLLNKNSRDFRQIICDATLKMISENRVQAIKNQIIEVIDKKIVNYKDSDSILDKCIDDDFCKNVSVLMHPIVTGKTTTRNDEKDDDRAKSVQNELSECSDGTANFDLDGLLNGMSELIKDYFTYHGVVEKYFSTIIDPIKIGNDKFWVLVNYFWSAFFCIYRAMIGKNGDKEESKDYQEFLANPKKKIEELYSITKIKSMASQHENYYSQIVEHLDRDAYYAITTNYTPFAKLLEQRDDVDHVPVSDSIVTHIAGKLSWFEVVDEMRVIDLELEDLDENDFVIPYMYTQAPIKPIVEPKMIREYERMDRFLQESKYLVIIGHGLTQGDLHLLAYLREFLMKRDSEIILMKFVKPKAQFNSSDVQNKLIKSLRFADDARDIDGQLIRNKIRVETCDALLEVIKELKAVTSK